jgi:hypothetical protein
VNTHQNTHKPVAALMLPRRIQQLIAYARAIVAAMTGNAAFPTPAPTLAAVTAAIDALANAETTALTRAKGAAAVRNEKLTALVALLKQLVRYVQNVADVSAENGTSIIESAGMSVKKAAVRKPRVFGAATGPVSGSAKLVAPSSGSRASYEWQSSVDGGKTWVTAPATMQASTVVEGLTPGANVLFRYRPVTKSGEGDWSQSVALIIR